MSGQRILDGLDLGPLSPEAQELQERFQRLPKDEQARLLHGTAVQMAAANNIPLPESLRQATPPAGGPQRIVVEPGQSLPQAPQGYRYVKVAPRALEPERATRHAGHAGEAVGSVVARTIGCTVGGVAGFALGLLGGVGKEVKPGLQTLQQKVAEATAPTEPVTYELVRD